LAGSLSQNRFLRNDWIPADSGRNQWRTIKTSAVEQAQQKAQEEEEVKA